MVNVKSSKAHNVVFLVVHKSHAYHLASDGNSRAIYNVVNYFPNINLKSSETLRVE